MNRAWVSDMPLAGRNVLFDEWDAGVVGVGNHYPRHEAAVGRAVRGSSG